MLAPPAESEDMMDSTDRLFATIMLGGATLISAAVLTCLATFEEGVTIVPFSILTGALALVTCLVWKGAK